MVYRLPGIPYVERLEKPSFGIFLFLLLSCFLSTFHGILHSRHLQEMAQNVPLRFGFGLNLLLTDQTF